MAKKKNETTIKDIIDVFLPKLWIMLLVGAILAIGVFAYSALLKQDEYTSSLRVYVYNDKSSSGSLSATEIQAAQEMVDIYKIAMRGDVFLGYVAGSYATATGETLGVAEAAGYISIQQVDDDAAFDVIVTTTDPEKSYAIAQTVRDEIETHLQGNIIKNSLGASIVDEPQLASSPNGKNEVRNAIIAFLIGVVITAAVVWIYSSFDVVIRSAKKIEDNFDIPILGIIPRHEIASSEEARS